MTAQEETARALPRMRLIALATGALLATGAGVAVAADGGSPTPQATSPSQVSPASTPAGIQPRAAATTTASTTATNAHCGQVLTASLTLNGDLACNTTYALTLKSNSITLNLNGHQISSTTTGTDGIKCSGNTDTIKNGTVIGFRYNILVNQLFGYSQVPTTCTISGVVSDNGTYGILDNGAGTKITGNTLSANQQGILSRDDEPVITGNHISDTAYDGIYLDTDPSATVTNNVVTGSGHYGIDIDASGGKFGGNVLENNALGGFYASASHPIDLGGDIASGNGVRNAATGAQCNGVTCIAP